MQLSEHYRRQHAFASNDSSRVGIAILASSNKFIYACPVVFSRHSEIILFHIKVRSPGNGVITSELYFSVLDQDKLRAKDPVYQRQRQKKLIVQRENKIAGQSW